MLQREGSTILLSTVVTLIITALVIGKTIGTLPLFVKRVKERRELKKILISLDDEPKDVESSVYQDPNVTVNVTDSVMRQQYVLVEKSDVDTKTDNL